MKTKIFSAIFMVLLITGTKVFAGDPVNVPRKVLISFEKSFSDIQDEVWHKVNSFYEVSFFEPVKKSWCRIIYSSDGEILETLKKYKAEGLPLFIRANIGKEYPGKEIHSVSELHSKDETTYYLLLMDEDHIYKVTSDGYGNLKLNETLTRAK